MIPFSETGGSAKWANFYAPLLSEALPGNPTVVVKFMPGADSTKGANWFQGQKYEDSQGTLIFGSSGSTQFPYLLGDPRVRYEYKNWHVVLASGTGGVAYLPPDLARKMNGLDPARCEIPTLSKVRKALCVLIWCHFSPGKCWA